MILSFSFPFLSKIIIIRVILYIVNRILDYCNWDFSFHYALFSMAPCKTVFIY